jgi:hypothetical protein
MACSGFKGVVSVLVAGAMFVSSTGAAAANLAAPSQVSSWAMLSVLSGGAPAAAACGAAAVAAVAQAPAGGCVLPAVDTPPPVAQSQPPAPIPVPPVEGPSQGFGISPILLGLVAIAAGVGLYFALRHHHANSPS